MKTLLNAMVISFAMYSKIPMPRVEWSKENMKYSMCFFPAVGMVIGALVTAWGLVGARAVMSPAFNTAVMILIPVFVTGGLHLDGLLDTADAMSSYQSRERRLEILKDSNSGAFAVITCVCYFILDYGVWTEVKGEALLVLSLGFVLSRSLSGLSVVSFRCARNTGLAVAFAEPAQKKTVQAVMAVHIAAVALLMCLISVPLAAAALAAAACVFGYYRYMSYTHFGGITGDLAGFFLQVCELGMALAVAAVGLILG